MILDRALIAALPINAHEAGQALGSWQANPAFSADLSLAALVGRHGATYRMRRQDLFHLGVAARGGNLVAARELLVGTFVWGHSKVNGRGNPERVLGNVGAGPIAPPQFALLNTMTSPRAVFQALKSGGVGNVGGWGPSFFTKYLYFLHFRNPAFTVYPLIYDERVRNCLNGTRNTLTGAKLTVGWIYPHKTRYASANDYAEYCQSLDSWAASLSTPRAVVTPDQVERYLFG